MKLALCFVPLLLAAVWLYRVREDLDDYPIDVPNLKIDLVVMVTSFVILFGLLFLEMFFNARYR